MTATELKHVALATVGFTAALYLLPWIFIFLGTQ